MSIIIKLSNKSILSPKDLQEGHAYRDTTHHYIFIGVSELSNGITKVKALSIGRFPIIHILENSAYEFEEVDLEIFVK